MQIHPLSRLGSHCSPILKLKKTHPPIHLQRALAGAVGSQVTVRPFSIRIPDVILDLELEIVGDLSWS